MYWSRVKHKTKRIVTNFRRIRVCFTVFCRRLEVTLTLSETSGFERDHSWHHSGVLCSVMFCQRHHAVVCRSSLLT